MARIAMKSATYSAAHFTGAVGVAYAVTGSWAAALGVGLIEPLVQTVIYNAHEAAWGRAESNAPRPSARA